MTTIRKGKSLAILAGFSLLSACVSFGGTKPPPYLLSLTSDSKPGAGAARSGPQSGALVVRLPSAPQKLNNVRVPVRAGATTIAYLKDAIWVDKPARLFQGLLTETIAAKNDRLVLTPAQASGRAETYLSGELINFGLDGPSLTVTVTYDAVKMRDGQPVEKRRFEASENVFAAEAGPVGEALNSAANKVVLEVAEWVG
ncbi:ABC-type transport auxiliary lipoprotein family protein [Parasphingorhabdus cellanae]|uniref:Membrane integrity-associated transporter subunit PqiC n=1 Tax=Parasphingorhabdus cellanae TaxID=2806553 RepID=A0ABX7TAM1_9SPHN|nr:ABC-type transport auxiliary lipoprotein family protein [Parasphingorhabdus cellanae]QTD57507.1 membrane integrity-associated transporter subunit PqiC [Parasphingorhabdus cellanae]